MGHTSRVLKSHINLQPSFCLHPLEAIPGKIACVESALLPDGIRSFGVREGWGGASVPADLQRWIRQCPELTCRSIPACCRKQHKVGLFMSSCQLFDNSCLSSGSSGLEWRAWRPGFLVGFHLLTFNTY